MPTCSLPCLTSFPLARFCDALRRIVPRRSRGLGASTSVATLFGPLLGWGVALGIAGGIASPAQAQDASSLPQSMVETTSALNAEAKQRLTAFVRSHVAQIAEGEPDRISRSRAELSTPPGRPGASETFRREYAAIVRPALLPILDSENEMRAVNALIVLAALRSPESLDILLDRSDPSKEPRVALRIRAASSLGDSMAQTVLTPAQIDGAVRRILASANQESEWVPLVHHFRAILRAATLPGLPDASVAAALRAETELLAQLVRRIANEPTASPRMFAVAQSLLVVRNQLTVMPAARALSLRRDLAPTLVAVARTASQQWESARSDAELSRAYGAALGVADLLLALAAADRQASTTFGFTKAWESGNKTEFDAELKRAETLFPRGG